ncbi:MAG: sulfotransferase [Proteobacteria bacterium]|nr:sulfotransferase [Pseudomonadota bacterium]
MPLPELSLTLEKISAALSAGDIPQATGLARDALEQGNEHPLLFNLRAFWFESQKQNVEALADLRRAQQLAPDDPIVLNALGLACARMDLFAEARDWFRTAKEREPRFAPAHFNHGWVSEELGDLDMARASFLEHTRRAPDNADPWGRLAALSARLGEWDAARSHAARARARDPGHVAAALALASCEAADRNFAAAARLIDEVLASPRTSAVERAIALGQRGDLLHAQKKYDEAFASYTAGNQEIRAIHLERFTGPNVETIPQYLGWLLRYFEKTTPWSPSPAPHAPASGHVFIVGFPRSGTTLMEEALAAHPDVVTTGEKDGLPDSVLAFMGSPAGLDRLKTASEATLENARATYWRRLEEQGIDGKGRILIDKQPYNTMKLPLIARLFPDARIVFAVRDPRDVVLSCFRRRFRMNASNFELLTVEGAALFYDAVMRLADVLRGKLPLTMMQIRHEDLIADLPARLREICDFSAIPWSDNLSTFAQQPRGRAIATPSASQIVQGVNQEGVAQWRKYERHLASMLPVLEPWAARFGYPP